MHSESSKIQQLLRSSSRVAKARKMLGLKKDEYLVSFSSGEVIIGNNNNKKTRTVKKISGQSASKFLVGVVMPYIQKEIVEYFNLPINGLKCVLMGRPRFKGYSFEADGKTQTLKIKFAEKLNSAKLQYLLKQITEWNDALIKEPCPYERAKPIEYFDEKVLITREYNDLRKKYPTKIPKEILDKLVKKARKLLGIKTAYTADSLRKTISEFAKIFEG